MKRIEEFGRAVRRLRIARGLTQLKLAEKSGVHINTISFVERGLIPPALDTICSIADALDVRVSELAREMEMRDKSKGRDETPLRCRKNIPDDD